MRIIKRRLWTGWSKRVIISIFVFMPCSVNAEEKISNFTYTVTGKLVEQAAYYDLQDDSLLNPRNLLDFSPWKNRFYGDINIHIKYKEKTKLIYKGRPTFSSDEERTRFRHHVDDFYLDKNIKDMVFLYIGKRNISDGVALGTNPTDFLGEGKEVDLTKREEERRLEREGNYVVGFDAFYKDMTWTGILAPQIPDEQAEPDRVLLRANYFIERANTDLSVHYFHAKIPRSGLNISHTVSENLVLYTEAAFRQGSDKRVVALVHRGNPNVYSIQNRDPHVLYSHVAMGGHYTFKNGTNIISEYIYRGDGYDQKEWDAFEDFVTYSSDQFEQGRFLDSVLSNLLQVNQIVKFSQMRKNYFFTRMSNPSLLNKIDGALVFYVNLDDGSFLANPSFDYNVNARSTIGISSNIFVGGKTDEFGIMYWGEDVTFIYKYLF